MSVPHTHTEPVGGSRALITWDQRSTRHFHLVDVHTYIKVVCTVLLSMLPRSRYHVRPQGEYCSVTVKGKSVGILRPITYMNNSGMSARKASETENPRVASLEAFVVVSTFC